MFKFSLRFVAFQTSFNKILTENGKTKSSTICLKRFLSDSSNKLKTSRPKIDESKWREAATLMLIAKDAQKDSSSEFDYSTLLIKRAQKSSFMPTSFVFPGGVTETLDFHSSWLDVFAKNGFSKQDLDDYFSKFKTHLQIVSKSVTIRNSVPSEKGFIDPNIALRICAIRETFEETGLFICFEIYFNLIIN